jgi:aspartate/methionine/tyrosine aminotransferase
VSVLSDRVTGGSLEGILAAHSLSKRSNLAGYRFGSVMGDPSLVGRLLEIRKHLGLMVPAPVQAAAAAALDDDAHAVQQRERYRRRREVLASALRGAGFAIDHSEAGLYLWATEGKPCWETVAWFAERGVVVTPGDFYGLRGAHHVRVALTVSDERADLLPERLAS